MRRYFFHIAENERERDYEGTDFPGDDAAREEAVRFAGAVLSDDPGLVGEGRDLRIEVTDAEKRLLFSVVTLVRDVDHGARR